MIKKEFTYKGRTISFRQNDDGIIFINASELSKSFTLKPDAWMKATGTKMKIRALCFNLKCPISSLTQEIKGGRNHGTWFRSELAEDYVKALDKDFSDWVKGKVEAIRNVNQKAESKTTALPKQTNLPTTLPKHSDGKTTPKLIKICEPKVSLRYDPDGIYTLTLSFRNM